MQAGKIKERHVREGEESEGGDSCWRVEKRNTKVTNDV